MAEPTPTAECGICEGTGKWTEVVRDGHVPRVVLRDCPVHGSKQPAEPPRIEDMAAGTTFRFGKSDTLWTLHYNATFENFYLVSPDGSVWQADDIDPSTIRDVTPPAEQP